MAKKKLDIDDLLNALQRPEDYGLKADLGNSKEIWALIGKKDFNAIAKKAGVDESEVQEYLKKWIEENPYNNI